jgi:3-hydroxyacyl-CoA dehydrogenase
MPAPEIRTVAVIGAGTMGGGIAMNFLNAGIPVQLLERTGDALDKGIEIIRTTYASAVKKGRMTDAQLDERMALLSGTLDYTHIHDADLVIEAVFEDMHIKQDVFRKLDQVCKQGAILSTNTSTLDVDAIAAVTRRPESVIGLHFFAPANIMSLLEIVRGRKTSRETVAAAMAVAKSIKKTGVLVRVCFGFVGNRMFLPYVREAQLMVLEGVAPERIDKLAYDWGMAMGPLAVMDLSGLDVFYRINQAWPDKPDDPAYFRMCNVLYELGRIGQKSGAGFYRYQGREAVADDTVMKIAGAEADRLRIIRRDITDEEIIERLFYSMINEGAHVLQEGIAMRPGDIDVIFVQGYGMPRYRGGPMCYANMLGLARVREAILRYRDRYGERYWTPAPLLDQLARQGKDFGSG